MRFLRTCAAVALWSAALASGQEMFVTVEGVVIANCGDPKNPAPSPVGRDWFPSGKLWTPVANFSVGAERPIELTASLELAPAKAAFLPFSILKRLDACTPGFLREASNGGAKTGAPDKAVCAGWDTVKAQEWKEGCSGA